MTDRSQMRRLLWRWGRSMEYCKTKQREMEDYQDMADAQRGLASQQMTGMPHGSAISKPTERAAVRMNGLADVYAMRAADLAGDCETEMRFTRIMDELIEELPSEHQKVLELRYKGGHGFQFIAFKMNYSADRAKHIDAEAVDRLRQCVEVSTF